MIATFAEPLTLLSNLKAALFAVSEDFTRPALNSIRVELRNGVARFVATDGHWMWVNEFRYREIVGIGEKGKEILGDSSATLHILRADVVAMIKAIEAHKKCIAWGVELDTTAHTLRALSTTVSFKADDGSVFPPYAQVIPGPSTGSSRVNVAIAASLLTKVSAAFAAVSTAHCKSKEKPASNTGLILETGDGSLDPITVTSPACSDALAVVMPMRVDGADSRPAALRARYKAEPAAPLAKVA